MGQCIKQRLIASSFLPKPWGNLLFATTRCRLCPARYLVRARVDFGDLRLCGNHPSSRAFTDGAWDERFPVAAGEPSIPPVESRIVFELSAFVKRGERYPQSRIPAGPMAGSRTNTANQFLRTVLKATILADERHVRLKGGCALKSSQIRTQGGPVQAHEERIGETDC